MSIKAVKDLNLIYETMNIQGAMNQPPPPKPVEPEDPNMVYVVCVRSGDDVDLCIVKTKEIAKQMIEDWQTAEVLPLDIRHINDKKEIWLHPIFGVTDSEPWSQESEWEKTKLPTASSEEHWGEHGPEP
jgi:hypothetical protein